MGYLDLPEKELIARAVAGDQMAYRAIYQLHEKAIRSRVSGYFTWKADVDDVVSESFQKAFANLANFDTTREFRPWLSTIATRTALDHLASIKREDAKKEGIKMKVSESGAEGPDPRRRDHQRREPRAPDGVHRRTLPALPGGDDQIYGRGTRIW